ncbi:MAG: sugar ABC transporter substrate-binding protein [Candidatus Zhuqueibacterota bacterium]
MKMRLTLFIILALMLFFSCSKKNSDRVELSFWAMGSEGQVISEIINKFHELHPNIHVKVQAIPWGAAHEKLLTATAGHSTPDVCQLGNTWISEFNAIDAIIPLDTLIQHSTIQADRFFPGVWNTNTIGDRVYGIPWYVDTRLLFYRKDILSAAGYTQPPGTWEEWRNAARNIVASSRFRQKQYGFFFSLIYNDWHVPVILVLENNGRLLKENDCYGAFDDPQTVEALQFYTSLFKEGLAPRSMSEFTNIYQGFQDGAFAFVVTGPWNIGEIRRRMPEMENVWATAPMPRKLNGNSVAAGSSLVIFKSCRHKKEAITFIEFLSSVETQVQFFQMTRDLPAVKQAWDAEEIQTDEKIMAFYRQLESVVATPKIPEWERIAVKIQEHLERVVFEETMLEKAIRDLNNDVDRILEKRRWLLSKGVMNSGE